ncbi:hypothetical protein LXL04_018019 [Taraxacum kok-saghyz]
MSKRLRTGRHGSMSAGGETFPADNHIAGSKSPAPIPCATRFCSDTFFPVQPISSLLNGFLCSAVIAAERGTSHAYTSSGSTVRRSLIVFLLRAVRNCVLIATLSPPTYCYGYNNVFAEELRHAILEDYMEFIEEL